MNITISLNGTDRKESFRAGAFWHEYMTHAGKCGCCGSESTLPTLRSIVAKQGPNAGKRYDYYEARCLNPNCRAVFAFGQKQDEAKTLFPKRDKGWQKFSMKDDGASGGGHAGDDGEEIPF